MTLLDFFAGAVTFGFFACALFFLRFWRRTRDFLFQSFAIAYVSTGGGPNGASRILPILIYEEGFRNFRQGYGSTLALLMLVVMGAISLLQVRALRTRVGE